MNLDFVLVLFLYWINILHASMSSSEYKQYFNWSSSFLTFVEEYIIMKKYDEFTVENESSDDSLSLYFVGSYKTEITVDILFISLSCKGLGSSKRLQ